jgi:hypothetical protein
MCPMNICRELKETGQKYGVCGTLCHIVRTKPSGSPSSFLPGCHHQYTMRVASVGEARAVLCRRSGLINLSQTLQTVSTIASMSHCIKLHTSTVSIEPSILCYCNIFTEPKSQPVGLQWHVSISHS